ncbi:hypothetical protein HZS61_008696 [Fusarium oxysporum f. sp. conglutinans]|uniref:BAH domain-containing protein n=1 Tax=Fusarium oxysporum f. sp. conglutinans TaxID=100902 RepID=A0A8H6LQ81_FUSOX|nr:hypothetical protein HZS61_008696 [Fusarium oxysporum f. sp. conglutinans]KAG6990126.1 hypothetical protein FocnCong_v020100 [Fusarium oxysporum f. sp. conglutinans]KAI8416358.1 hypothetical protein FOFC_02667 [Fusarium oxysporum]
MGKNEVSSFQPSSRPIAANERTIEQQKAQGDRKHIHKSNEYWVAFILEIRASDDDHVYARVYWMYWPEDLPRVDIIDVVSVAGPAAVTQWIETHDQEIQSAMYWRQGYDYRTLQLSSAELVCNCQTPANPDKTLIGCTISERKRWMHYECAARDVLMKVYQRLGTDKPHQTEGLAAKEGKLEEVARLLSPTDAEKTETQPMIYVRSAEMNDDAQAKRPTQETRPETVTLTLGPTQPHLELFSANLKTQDHPIVWEIHDLRKNVRGGEKVWTEEAHCPCGTPLHFGFNMTTT